VKEYILKIRCKDGFGIVSRISEIVTKLGFFFRELKEYGDKDTNTFFMLTKIASLNEFNHVEFQKVADDIGATWSLKEVENKPKTAIFVSKYGHCLHDILYKWSAGELNIDIQCVISNHEDMRKLVEGMGIEYRYIPITKETKEEQEEITFEILEERNIELVVLARYMQILSPTFCKLYSGKIINIHHSFLPGFKGARPYHQAHDRGVKILGATAHYVTADLDEGPIIEQMVERIDHSKSPKDMELIGRDLEKATLSKAIKYHSEQRIFLNGNKTVIF
jgi:formyltetrahydrofolate deformylase